MRQLILGLIVLLAVPAAVAESELAQQSDVGQIQVDSAWVRTPPPGARMLAGYATLRNDSDADVVIVAAESERFGMVEIHESYREGERVRMRRIPELLIPAGESVTLEPGGLHLMLMRPESPVEDGELLAIDLIGRDMRFDATFPVRREAPQDAVSSE